MFESIVVVCDPRDLYPEHSHKCDPRCTKCGKQYKQCNDGQFNEDSSQQSTQENIAPSSQQVNPPAVEPEKPFQCRKCGERFVRPHHLRKHKYTHTEDRVYKCSECDRGFTKESTLKQHMQKHDLTSRQCKVCSRICRNPALLRAHMLTHTGVRDYPCKACGKEFKTLSAMKRHLLFVHTELSDTPVDKRKYKKYYPCPECNKQTSDLKQHMMLHTGEKNFQCTVCERRFFTKSQKDRHMYTHTDEKKYSCTVCGKLFKSQHNVKTHMHYHKERHFKCSLCDKAFKKSDRLKLHMLTHTGEKKHQCPVCGKAFSRSHDIKPHMLVHNIEKNFQCKECSKWFSTDGKLQRHLLSHKTEKRYKCTECFKSYPRISDLNEHMSSHRGQTYQCTVCDKGFTHNSNLERHMLAHTAQDRSESNSLPGQTQNVSLPTQSEIASLPTQTESESQPEGRLLKETQPSSSNLTKPAPTIVIFPGNYMFVKDEKP